MTYSCRRAGKMCTRSCKGCKRESCTNAIDLVEDIDHVKEDGEVDDDDDEYEMNADGQNKNRSAYRRIMQRIYGSDDSDSDNGEGNEESNDITEEEQEQQEAGKATGSQTEEITERVETRTVQNFDKPNCSGIPPLKNVWLTGIYLKSL